MRRLGIRRADFHPKATEHIDDIIAFVQKLMDKGWLIRRAVTSILIQGPMRDTAGCPGKTLKIWNWEPVLISTTKRRIMDFVLWKRQKPGEPAWDSLWGPAGRWHIECSVMATKYLGETIDIHSGGQDLIFPHHENEIAQSEGATGKPFARYWLHNGYINVDNRKMSKSLGNFFTVRDISKDFDPEVVRLFMLSSHYRNPINFSRSRWNRPKVHWSACTPEQLGTSFKGCGRKPADESEKQFGQAAPEPRGL